MISRWSVMQYKDKRPPLRDIGKELGVGAVISGTVVREGARVRIRIGEGTWVGSAAIILADVGKHCVIGAGAVVTSPIPDYAIAAGVPAKVIRDRRDATDDRRGNRELVESGLQRRECRTKGLGRAQRRQRERSRCQVDRADSVSRSRTASFAGDGPAWRP